MGGFKWRPYNMVGPGFIKSAKYELPFVIAGPTTAAGATAICQRHWRQGFLLMRTGGARDGYPGPPPGAAPPSQRVWVPLLITRTLSARTRTLDLTAHLSLRTRFCMRNALRARTRTYVYMCGPRKGRILILPHNETMEQPNPEPASGARAGAGRGAAAHGREPARAGGRAGRAPGPEPRAGGREPRAGAQGAA